jgi:hypothetical protein
LRGHGGRRPCLWEDGEKLEKKKKKKKGCIREEAIVGEVPGMEGEARAIHNLENTPPSKQKNRNSTNLVVPSPDADAAHQQQEDPGQRDLPEVAVLHPNVGEQGLGGGCKWHSSAINVPFWDASLDASHCASQNASHHASLRFATLRRFLRFTALRTAVCSITLRFAQRSATLRNASQRFAPPALQCQSSPHPQTAWNYAAA